MISAIMFLVGIIAGATLYGDNLLIPIGIVALVTTIMLIFYPAASLAEALMLLGAVTIWYAGAIYLTRCAYIRFVQK